MSATAQQAMSYSELLERTTEVELSDSLQFRGIPDEVTALDSNTVKDWFPRVLPAGAVNKFKNRVFSLAGKITTQESFDLLILLEEKRRSDIVDRKYRIIRLR